MSKLRNLAGRFKTLNINTMLDSAIMQTEKELTDLNKNQLKQGQDSNGSALPYYSQVSIDVYGKSAGPWTLHDTFSFYNGFFANIKRDSISIFSTDNKTQMLLDKTSDNDIFGLHINNRITYSLNFILPYLQSNIKSHLKI